MTTMNGSIELPSPPGLPAEAPGASRSTRRAFTLVELLAVIALVLVMMALVIPALPGLKDAGDATAAAHDVAGALEIARSYAKANNTYTWVGFFEEDASKASTTPATSGTGRIVLSIVASKDGTMIYNPNDPSITPESMTQALKQINKLVKIDNAHLKTAGDSSFPIGSGAGDDAGGAFETRPAVGGTTAQIGDTSPGDSQAPFQYPVGDPVPSARYTFRKALQFSPSGEVRVNDASQPLQTIVEIGLQPTHGAVVDTNNTNVAAVQITGITGNVKIYRR